MSTQSQPTTSDPCTSAPKVSAYEKLVTPVIGLFMLAVAYTLYLAHEILLPIVLALLLSLLFSPLVAKASRKLGVPKAISSLFLMVLVLAVIAGLTYSVVTPLLEWADRAPHAMQRVLVGESQLQRSLEKLQDSAKQIEENMEEEGADVETPQTVVLQTDTWRSKLMSKGQSGVVGLALALALTYFLLVSGDTLVRNLARQMKRRRRCIFLRIVRSGQQQVARYLAVISLTNTAIGIAVGLIAWGAGLPTPVLWGLVAALTRFIPYIGVILGVSLFAVVSVMTFDEIWMMAVVPGSFLLMTTIIGFFLEPYIHGMRLAVNPVIIFVSIFFWGWFWGPVGVLLAVPLMTVIMVIISHIPKLKPLSEVLRK